MGPVFRPPSGRSSYDAPAGGGHAAACDDAVDEEEAAGQDGEDEEVFGDLSGGYLQQEAQERAHDEGAADGEAEGELGCVREGIRHGLVARVP